MRPGGARLPLQGLWQKLRLPRPLALAWLCWIPGNLEISARIGRLDQRWWQQGHLTRCGHGMAVAPGAPAPSTGLAKPPERVTQSPGALSTCATLWGRSGGSPAKVPARGAAAPDDKKWKPPPFPAASKDRLNLGEKLHPAAKGNKETWDEEVTPRTAVASLSPAQWHTEGTSVTSWLGQTRWWGVEDWM